MYGLLMMTKIMQCFALREFVSCPWRWCGQYNGTIGIRGNNAFATGTTN